MPTFKLHRDILIPQWWRDYYEIEADSIEDAIDKLITNKEDYYDSEPLDIVGEPIKQIIEDEKSNELYVID